MRSHLRFDVGSEVYVLPLDSVAEVARALPLHAIPSVGRDVGGVVNLRGEPLPAVYGGALLGGSPAREHRHLLVLEEGGRRVGIVVERATGIEGDLGKAVPADPEVERPGSDIVRWVELYRPPALGCIEAGALFAGALELLNTDARSRAGSEATGEATCHDAF